MSAKQNNIREELEKIKSNDLEKLCEAFTRFYCQLITNYRESNRQTFEIYRLELIERLIQKLQDETDEKRMEIMKMIEEHFKQFDNYDNSDIIWSKIALLNHLKKNENKWPKLIVEHQQQSFEIIKLFKKIFEFLNRFENEFEVNSIDDWNLEGKEQNKQVFIERIGNRTNPTSYSRFYGSSGAVYLVNLLNKRTNQSQSLALKMIYNFDDHLHTLQLENSIKNEVELINAIHLNSINNQSTRFVIRYFDYRVQYFEVKKLPDWDVSSDTAQSKMATISMEYIPLTIQQRISRIGPFNEQSALLIILQIALAVRFINSLDIVHRDLKSDNILIDNHNRIILFDFSCAIQLDNLIMPFPIDNTSKGGNSLCLPPEILKTKAGKGVELNYQKTDVWAIGSLAYLLVGVNHPLYEINYPKDFNDDKLQTINEMMKREIVSSNYNRIAKSLLCHSFDDRLSIDQLIDEIDRLLWSNLFGQKQMEIEQYINHQLFSILQKEQIEIEDSLMIDCFIRRSFINFENINQLERSLLNDLKKREYDSEIASLQTVIKLLQSEINERDSQIQTRNKKLREKDLEIQKLQNDIKNLQYQLDKSSPSISSIPLQPISLQASPIFQNSPILQSSPNSLTFTLKYTKKNYASIKESSSKLIGSIGVNMALDARSVVLGHPRGIYCDHHFQSYFVSEYEYHRIQVINSLNSQHIRFIGQSTKVNNKGISIGSTEIGQLCAPWGLKINRDSRLFVCDGRNKRIQGFNSTNGSFIHHFNTFSIGNPRDIEINSNDQLIVSHLIPDIHKSVCQIGLFINDGTSLLSFGPKGTSEEELFEPCGLALDSNGMLLIGDSNNNRICVFDRNYSFIHSFGSFSGECIHLTIDRFDRIIVSDRHNLHFFDSNYQLISTFGLNGDLNGVDIDHNGSIVVCEYYDNRLRIISVPTDQ